MKYLNQKDFEFYSKYEDIFNTAVFGNFKHSTNILTDKRLGEIYTQTTGELLDSFSCNACNLRNYIKMGKLYFATKKHLETIENEDRNRDERAEGDDTASKNSGHRRTNKKRDVKRKEQ